MDISSLKLIASQDQKLEVNKKTVLAFYEAFERHDFPAAAKLLGKRYVQHKPDVADGVQGFKAFVDVLAEKFPNLKISIKRLLAEGDFVTSHIHGVRVPGQRGTAIMDLFRLEDGLIVEHWDVIQPIPDEALNQNGMF
jgi:predicted SnoaL-like aldol condensation-catalyzing enzyme